MRTRFLKLPLIRRIDFSLRRTFSKRLIIDRRRRINNRSLRFNLLLVFTFFRLPALFKRAGMRKRYPNFLKRLMNFRTLRWAFRTRRPRTFKVRRAFRNRLRFLRLRIRLYFRLNIRTFFFHSRRFLIRALRFFFHALSFRSSLAIRRCFFFGKRAKILRSLLLRPLNGFRTRALMRNFLMRLRSFFSNFLSLRINRRLLLNLPFILRSLETTFLSRPIF